MKKINFIVLLITVLMAITTLFISCDVTTKPSENKASTSSTSAQCTHDHTRKMTTDPTCTQDGVVTITCSICNDVLSEETTAKALGHDFIDHISKIATCDTQGEKRYECSRCSFSYTENYNLTNYSASEVYNLSKALVGEITTYDKRGNELALGTCFVYSSDGEFVTNYHVIEDAYSAKITVNGDTYTVHSILAYDKMIDLAILKINATGLSVLHICTQEHSVGKAVYAIGSSKGLTETFSQGIITYADREIDGVHYVQHNAAISNGNSGGPLINQCGEVIGINTMTIKDAQNLNFAISVKELSNLKYGSPLTFAQFYEKECDVYTKIKNYVVQSGTYSSSDNEYTLTLGNTYSSDNLTKYTREITYDVTDDKLSLRFWTISNSMTALCGIYIDEIDYVYSWAYADTYDYSMAGTLYATTFTSSSLLGYSYNNISSASLRTSVRELASLMVRMLISYIDADLVKIGVTAADLGFVNF